MSRQEGLEEAVLQKVASLEFVAPYRLEDAKEQIRSALVSAPRLYFSLIRHRSDWPISGRVTNNGFQIRTRSAWSNGSNLVWALGKFEPEDGKTKVRVRFVPEPIGTAGVVLIFVVVVVLFAAHSWVAWALLAFVILVLGTAFPVARSERDALARFLLGRLRS
jgi:hypothetical protein